MTTQPLFKRLALGAALSVASSAWVRWPCDTKVLLT